YGGYLAAILTSLRAGRWLGPRAPAPYEGGGWGPPERGPAPPTGPGALPPPGRPAGGEVPPPGRAGLPRAGVLVGSEPGRVVPHPVIESYLAACVHARSLTYRVLEGADHGLSEEPWRSAYAALLVSWLNEMTAGLRGPR